MRQLRYRHEQFVYWSSIALDCIRGSHSKSVYVLGYCKSGTNWLCNLVSGVLGFPVLEPWNMYLPGRGPYVFHMHRFIPQDSVRRRTFYIMRDGRDVMLSFYFHLAREGGPVASRFERATGRKLVAEAAGENLPDFIRFMQTNRSPAIDYRSHLLEWSSHRKKYVTLRYEDLLEDTAGELTRVLRLSQMTGSVPDKETVRHAVAKQEFARIAKRARGVEDQSAFLRKGVHGDWKNYFSAEAAQVFDAYAGDLLVDLGYEPDRKWVLDTCGAGD